MNLAYPYLPPKTFLITTTTKIRHHPFSPSWGGKITDWIGYDHYASNEPSPHQHCILAREKGCFVLPFFDITKDSCIIHFSYENATTMWNCLFGSTNRKFIIRLETGAAVTTGYFRVGFILNGTEIFSPEISLNDASHRFKVYFNHVFGTRKSKLVDLTTSKTILEFDMPNMPYTTGSVGVMANVIDRSSTYPQYTINMKSYNLKVYQYIWCPESSLDNCRNYVANSENGGSFKTSSGLVLEKFPPSVTMDYQ